MTILDRIMQTKQTNKQTNKNTRKNIKQTTTTTNKQTKKEGKRKQKEEYTLQTIIKMESITLKINTYPQIPCDFEMCQGH